MPALINRRNFLLRSGAAAGLLFSGCAHRRTSPNEKLNLGFIGVANRATANLHSLSGENIVALCDVDANFLAAARQEFPRAAAFRDFRKMLERTDLDAVVVSTPNHTHAVAVVAALRAGRHVYCNHVLLPEKDFPPPAQPGPGGDDHEKKHHQEWIQAIKTGGATSCNFDYAGTLAETVQLGNAAYRSGGKIMWDAARLEAVNNPRAAQYIHHHYRPGWKI